MVGLLVTLVGSVVALVAVVAVVFVLGMRARWPAVTGVVVALSKRAMNPAQMRTAGQPGAYAGVVHHRGRSSGRPYATPVGILPWDDGFVIALPYGANAQWVRNVLASGSAKLKVEGRTWAVDRPELVPTETVIDAFGPADRRLFRLLRTDRCLRLRRVDEAVPGLAAA